MFVSSGGGAVLDPYTSYNFDRLPTKYLESDLMICRALLSSLVEARTRTNIFLQQNLHALHDAVERGHHSPIRRHI